MRNGYLVLLGVFSAFAIICPAVARAQEKIFSSLPPPPTQAFAEYLEVPNTWFATNNRAGNNALEGYLNFPDSQTNAMSETTALHHKVHGRLLNLYGLILTKELIEDPRFSPLLKEAFTALAEFRERGLPIYANCDREIGLRQTPPPPGPIAFERWLPELTKRYDKLVAKVEEIEKQENLSPEVVVGIKNETVKRLLEHAVGIYIDSRSAQNRSTN